MRTFNGILASITVFSLSTAIPLKAEEILIRANSDQSGGYSEPDGQWSDAPISSAIADLPVGNARALVKKEGASYSGTALFTITPTTSGQAFLDMTWPDGVDSTDTSVLVTTPSGSELILVDMNPANSALANQWVRLATLITEENQEIRVAIQPHETATPNESSLLMVDSIRLTSQDTAMTDPNAVTVTTVKAAALRISNTDDPFAVANELSSQNPFEGGTTATASTDNPFEGAAATSDFATENPFAGREPAAENDADSNPFEGETESSPAQMADNPFETIDQNKPTQTAAETDNPFEAENSGYSNPFEGSKGTEIAVDDPFGTTTTSPFAGTSGAPTAVQLPAKSRPRLTTEAKEVDLDNLFADLESSNVTDAFLAPSTVSIDIESLEQTMTVSHRIQADPIIYHDTVEAAQVSAKNYGRNILVLFTGNSTRASEFENALENDELSDLLRNFELVKLPYASNRAKAREFAVNSFPYLVVINSNGFTKGHVVPTIDINRLKTSLSEYTNNYL